MKNEIKKFIVSCSDWEFEVDAENSKSASMCGLIMAIKKFGNNLLLSTTIMVKEIRNSNKKIIFNYDFFSMHETLSKLGLNDLAEGIKTISDLGIERELSVAS